MSSSAHLQEHLRLSYRRRKAKDLVMCGLLALAALVALSPLFSVLGYVVSQGYGHLNFAFFTQIPKPVGEVGGGMANALVGTLTLIGLASVIGIGWGVVTGVFLSEYGSGKTGSVIRFGVDMLASVPSIVVGLFVYAMIVVPMKRFSAIAGGVALGILMVPIVARQTEEMMRLMPTHIREAGLALGLPRWKVILHVVLRGCVSGIITGVMLGIARVAGETAPLLFTAMNNRFWQGGLDQPIASLPVQIYSYAISPFDDWHAQAWTGALVLVLLVFAINLATRLYFSTDGAGRE
jgi:phosphate transport system permease protein